MRRDVRIILATVFLAGTWALSARVPGWLAEMETFRVRDVQVRGARYLAPGEVQSLMAVAPGATIWEDAGPWEDRVARHALVAGVRVRRRLPGTLVVEVVEREPVALVATPTLEPVDATGALLPIDPSSTRLDLPVVAASGVVARGARLVPADTRRLLDEVARLMEGDTAFLQMVSEIGWLDGSTLVARWSDPPVDFLLRPGTPVHRFREGLLTLAHAVSQDPAAPPAVVDLRFADQVVVRRSPQE